MKKINLISSLKENYCSNKIIIVIIVFYKGHRTLIKYA